MFTHTHNDTHTKVMKRKAGLCNRRYSKNRRTGAKPKRAMGVGWVEQLANVTAAAADCAVLMRGTQRQQKSERENCRDQETRPQLQVKSAAELGRLKRRHNIT